MWIGASPPPCLGLPLGASETIAFPGLINSHDHLAFNCYPPTGTPPYRDFLGWSRDVQADEATIAAIEAIPPTLRRQIGLLKNLLWGVTAVADHGGADERDGPVRALAPYKDLHSPELGRPHSWLAGTGPVVMHLAEGVTSGSRHRALRYLGWNLWRRPVAGIHGVSLEAEDFTRLEALVWCPASNLFLFGRTADARAAWRHTALLFGTDATISAPGTLWDHLRLARGKVEDEAIFAALTRAAERFWGLAPRNDVVLARRKAADPWEAFFALTPDDILAVVKEGEPVLLDESLGSPDGFASVGRKRVRMDVAAMVEGLAAHAADPAEVFSRFTGSLAE